MALRRISETDDIDMDVHYYRELLWQKIVEGDSIAGWGIYQDPGTNAIYLMNPEFFF